MASDGKDINNLLRRPLIERIGRERFDLWFANHTSFRLRGDQLTVRTTNAFYRDWLRAHFRRDLEAVARAALGGDISLEFQIVEIAQTNQPADSTPSDKSAGKIPHSEAGRPNELTQTSQRQASRQADSDNSSDELPLPTQTDPAGRQCADRGAADRHNDSPNDSPKPQRRRSRRSTENPSGQTFARRTATFESFVVGATNRLAFTSAQTVLERPGHVSPLVIHGETGVGKTHLLEAVRTAARRSKRRLQAIYLTAEQFTSQFLEALDGRGLPNFRRKYRGVEILLIDDLQFFAGKRATLVELLYTIDTLLREGRQLVMTADRPPAQLDGLGAELTARLSGGLVCGLDPPDFAARRGIVAELARRFELDVPDDVQSLVAATITSGARHLSGALNRLHAVSLAREEPISRSLAETELVELTRQHGRRVQLPEIERAVCNLFGVSPKNLKSSQRGKAVSRPRMLAMWLARKHTRSGLSEIGQFFGRRSHSTVISANKQVERWLVSGAPLEVADRSCGADEAIRRVEQTLRIA